VVPRKNKRDISCVNCGACVAACRKELGVDKGLFQLGFGTKAAATGNRTPSPAVETACLENMEHSR
jgi:ferredoxin